MAPESPLRAGLHGGAQAKPLGGTDAPCVDGKAIAFCLSHQGIKELADKISPATCGAGAQALEQVAQKVETAATELQNALRAIVGAEWTGNGANQAGQSMTVYGDNAVSLALSVSGTGQLMRESQQAVLEFKNSVPAYTVAEGAAPSPDQAAAEADAQLLFQTYNTGNSTVDSTFPLYQPAHNPVGDQGAPVNAGPGSAGPAIGNLSQQSSTIHHGPADQANTQAAAANSPTANQAASNPAAPNPAAQNPGNPSAANPNPLNPNLTSPASVTPAHRPGYPPGVTPALPSPSRVDPNSPGSKPDWLRSPLPPGVNPDGSPRSPLRGPGGLGPHRLAPAGTPGMPGMRPHRREEDEERTRRVPDYLKGDYGFTNMPKNTTPPVLGG